MGSAFPTEVRDDAGRRLRLEAPPATIVSLVPSLTELLFALGAGGAVVGITRYCTHPPAETARLPRLGGTKNPDLDAIAALKPALVLMNAEENRREDFEALEACGTPIYVTEPKTVDAAIALNARLAAIVGRASAGGALVHAQREILSSVRTSARLGRPVRYFCPIWKRPWMGFNADTYAHDVLRCAGGLNLLADRSERYPAVELGELAPADPEVVLLPDEPYVFTAADISALAPLADSPALARDRVHLVDGKALSWYGPRIADGVRAFATLFDAAR